MEEQERGCNVPRIMLQEKSIDFHYIVLIIILCKVKISFNCIILIHRQNLANCSFSFAIFISLRSWGSLHISRMFWTNTNKRCVIGKVCLVEKGGAWGKKKKKKNSITYNFLSFIIEHGCSATVVHDNFYFSMTDNARMRFQREV